MLLTARFLQDVGGVNSGRPLDQAQMTAGDAPLLYFQLMDASAFRQDEGFRPPGRRYVAAAGATLTVTLLSIDSNKQVAKIATAPFSNDMSIWSIQMLSTDKIQGTVNLQLTLTEGGVVTHGVASAALLISCSNPMGL